jgi:predicted enzyme related to lactoylglutathione lyase
MGQPVVHFEVIGVDPARLRAYYRELFGWDSEAGSPVAPEVSRPDSYAFIERITTDDGTGIPGGIGGGGAYESHAIFYVGVSDVGEALRKAESLGGTRVMGPAKNEGGGIVVGHFTDPEGNLLGVAGPA